MIRFPIICRDGIGDTLIRLTEVPISAWGKIGVRFNIFYENRGHPAWPILQDLFNSLRYCSLLERTPTLNEYRARNIWQRISKGSKTLHAPPFVNEVKPELRVLGVRSVLLHSHMDGHHGHKDCWAKLWPVERWCALAHFFSHNGFEVGLLEYDAEAFKIISKACPFVKDARRPTLWETIQSIKKVDFVVSVDSWTKYVAGWWGIPQVVIVPDLRKGYTPSFTKMSADFVANYFFRGLLSNHSVCLIGLVKKSDVYEYTLSSLVDLDVDVVETAVQAVIKKATKKPTFYNSS